MANELKLYKAKCSTEIAETISCNHHYQEIDLGYHVAETPEEIRKRLENKRVNLIENERQSWIRESNYPEITTRGRGEIKIEEIQVPGFKISIERLTE